MYYPDANNDDQSITRSYTSKVCVSFKSIFGFTLYSISLCVSLGIHDIGNKDLQEINIRHYGLDPSASEVALNCVVHHYFS